MKNKLFAIAVIAVIGAISITGCKSKNEDLTEADKKRIESITKDNALKEADKILKEIDKL